MTTEEKLTTRTKDQRLLTPLTTKKTTFTSNILAINHNDQILIETSTENKVKVCDGITLKQNVVNNLLNYNEIKKKHLYTWSSYRFSKKTEDLTPKDISMFFSLRELYGKEHALYSAPPNAGLLPK